MQTQFDDVVCNVRVLTVMHSETSLLIRLCTALLCLGVPSGLVQPNHRLAIGFVDMRLDPWLSVLGNHNKMEDIASFCDGIVQLVSKRFEVHRVQQERNVHPFGEPNMCHMCKARQSRDNTTCDCLA